jgi:Family of unknown function (DUF5675)
MKVLSLKRIYTEVSTLGILSEGDIKLCYTIELPNRKNARGLSCIPEGRYLCKYEPNHRLGQVYRLQSVAGREGILIHVANKTSELRGCIAPNLTITSATEGKASQSAIEAIFQATARLDFLLDVK